MECVFTKKYEKVDSFLKRFLSHSRYTGVRLIEPCVAVSDVYNKQFKFVVLADEWLYVTENPPKVAKDIQEVTRIVDITSVELINDVPEFLGGDLKYRTHHILVTYKKGSESDVPAQLTPNSSPILLTKSLQENDLRNSRENSSSVDEICYDGQDVLPLDKLSKSLQENDLKNSRRKSHSINKVEENSSLSPDVLSTSRKSKDNLSRSLQENDLKNSRRKLSSDQLEENYSHSQDKSSKSKHSSSPILPTGRSRIRKQSGNSLDDDYLYENDSSLANSDTFQANQAQQNRLLPKTTILQEKTRRKSSPGTFYEDESLDQNSEFLMRSNDGLLSKSGKNNLSTTARTLKETSRRKSSPMTFSAKDEAFDLNSGFRRSSNDGRLSKLGENSLSPKPAARTLPGRKSGSNTPLSNEGGSFDQDANSKTRSSPIKFSSVDSEDGNFEPNSIPLHYSFSTADDFKSKNSSTRLTVSASAADLRAMQVKFDPTLNSGSEPNLTSTPKSGLMGSFNGLQSWFKERRSSKPWDKNAGMDKSAGQSSGDLDGSFKEEGSSEIHLYMILDDTVMLAYLRSIWDNCLLNSAVKYAKKERSPKTVVKNKPNSSQVTALFDQMEKEILNSEDFQATFELVHELLTACQKDVIVKKLFWQSPDLFVFLVGKINDYIKESPDEPMKANRADELEFVLLLIECLTEMFRETELLASRMTRLISKKYSVVRDLILASVACPELCKASSFIETPDISEAAEILLTGRHRKKKNKKEKSSHDIELENLSSELVRHQVALLHELFIIAYQAVWFPSDDKTLTISWMVKIVESSTTVHRYLQAFVEQVMEIITKAENNSLTSDDTTLLYRLLSVLKTIIQQSLKLRRHIHDFYTEEFRYYVKPHTISNSLSQDCPLTPSTLKLVDDVIGLVTDVPLKNRRPRR